MMFRRALAATVVIAITAGCGVPTGPDSYEAIPDDEVPNRLADTTTTSTTTTTTTLPPSPNSTLVTTTTTPLRTSNVEVFFVSRDKLRSIELPLPAPVADTDLISLLEAGPVGPSATVLSTYVKEGLILDTVAQGGTVTIDLDEEVFDDIATGDQREAIAQIVLTFLLGLRGVGLAVFTFNGSDENVSIPTADNLFTDEPVSLDDYASMRADLDRPPDSVPTDDEIAPSSTEPTTGTTTPETTDAPPSSPPVDQ